MNTIDRRNRIQELDIEIRTLQARIDKLHQERNDLQLEQKKEDYPCSCVKLNKDIEIFDMNEQVRRKRNPLSLGGFVADTLSAFKACNICQGTGQPIKHNHFGDVFRPDTCPACRLMQRNID